MNGLTKCTESNAETKVYNVLRRSQRLSETTLDIFSRLNDLADFLGEDGGAKDCAKQEDQGPIINNLSSAEEHIRDCDSRLTQLETALGKD